MNLAFKTNINQLIYFYTALIFLTGCKPLSKFSNTNIQTEVITGNDYEKLNGTYTNSYDTIFGGVKHSPNDGNNEYQRLTILYQLFGYKYPETVWRDKDNQMINPNDKYVKIEFLSKKQAIISMYHNDRFVFSRRIHGKFKNGYFYLRPKAYILPFIPLLFGYNYKRVRLGKTIENSLVINYKVNRWGFALFAGSADKGVATTIYNNKNK